ncbi:MAG: class I SAM-dependent methyltransferase [Acidobacteria bacterium]|nr:class I SAM-dependent methyltransferase [Acidobacteriota bacterium]
MPVDDASLPQWLLLREPADAAARSEALTRDVAGSLGSAEPLHMLDLGTGTGSNIRYLAERLRGPQRWLALDRSAALLAELPRRMVSWAATRGYAATVEGGRCTIRGARFECVIDTHAIDLTLLDDRRIFDGRRLVTASALLDLVSESWLAALAAHCAAENALALFALTYDGRSACAPADPEDEMVRELLNRHQRRDRERGGRAAGPAAGPDAGALAERCFANAGYRVRREPSDWRLVPADADMQRTLIGGWAEAATEMAPDRASAIASWHARRLAHVAAGRSSIVVGHDDLAAWPGPHRARNVATTG